MKVAKLSMSIWVHGCFLVFYDNFAMDQNKKWRNFAAMLKRLRGCCLWLMPRLNLSSLWLCSVYFVALNRKQESFIIGPWNSLSICRFSKSLLVVAFSKWIKSSMDLLLHVFHHTSKELRILMKIHHLFEEMKKIWYLIHVLKWNELYYTVNDFGEAVVQYWDFAYQIMLRPPTNHQIWFEFPFFEYLFYEERDFYVLREPYSAISHSVD